MSPVSAILTSDFRTNDQFFPLILGCAGENPARIALPQLQLGPQSVCTAGIIAQNQLRPRDIGNPIRRAAHILDPVGLARKALNQNTGRIKMRIPVQLA